MNKNNRLNYLPAGFFFAAGIIWLAVAGPAKLIATPLMIFIGAIFLGLAVRKT